MRIAAIGATFLIVFAACSTTQKAESPYVQPNSLMAGEISRRVEQIPYQHREELLESLMWLAQTGEQTIPSLLVGLRHENPKVRSSCAWVLGRIVDRRTIPELQQAMKDEDPTVRMECARTLVMLGDLTWSPTLIEGLDSERKEVRYLCHEALKTSTGHDFGYDHLNDNKDQALLSVLRWRQWWSEYSGDTFFAQNYQQKHNLDAKLAQPMMETRPEAPPANQPAPTLPKQRDQGDQVQGNQGNQGGQGSPRSSSDPSNGSTERAPGQEPAPIPAPANPVPPRANPLPAGNPAPAVRENGGS